MDKDKLVVSMTIGTPKKDIDFSELYGMEVDGVKHYHNLSISEAIQKLILLQRDQKMSKLDEYKSKNQGKNFLGEFQNEFGETFAVFKRHDRGQYYITGDEFDWETYTLLLSPIFARSAKKEVFTFSMDEAQDIYYIVSGKNIRREHDISKLFNN